MSAGLSSNKPNGEDVEPFFFVNMADCQLGMLKGNKNWTQEKQMLVEGIEIVNKMKPKPKFVTMCGDLINAFPTKKNVSVRAGQTKDLKYSISKLNKDIPFICMCGNHDVGQTPTKETMEEYRKTWGRDYYSFFVNNCRMVVINSQIYKDSSKTGDDFIAQEKWLAKEVNEEKERRDAPCIFFSHIPPFILNKNEKESWANLPMKHRKKLLEMSKLSGCVAWFCGHYHQNAIAYDEDLEIIISSAIGTAIDSMGKDFSQGLIQPMKLQIGKNVSGFRIVHVNQMGVRHQFFTLNDAPTELNVNIFSDKNNL